MDPIIQYLIDETLFKNFLDAKQLRWMASQYVLMNGQLYKKLFSLLLLKYLRHTDADYALWEVHEEIYENYLRNKLLAYKFYDKNIIGPPWRKMQLTSSIDANYVRNMPIHNINQLARWHQSLHYGHSYNEESTYSIHSLRCLVKKKF